MHRSAERLRLKSFDEKVKFINKINSNLIKESTMNFDQLVVVKALYSADSTVECLPKLSVRMSTADLHFVYVYLRSVITQWVSIGYYCGYIRKAISMLVR